MAKAKAGDVIRSEIENFDITKGNFYHVYEVHPGTGSGEQVRFMDDKGNRRAFYYDTEYTVIGRLQDMQAPMPKLEDLMGKELKEGDTIAYPVSVDRMEVLRIQSINRHVLTAVCTYVGSPISGSITVGCLDKRAIKVER